jgi:hypothetical protein
MSRRATAGHASSPAASDRAFRASRLRAGPSASRPTTVAPRDAGVGSERAAAPALPICIAAGPTSGMATGTPPVRYSLSLPGQRPRLATVSRRISSPTSAAASQPSNSVSSTKPVRVTESCRSMGTSAAKRPTRTRRAVGSVRRTWRKVSKRKTASAGNATPRCSSTGTSAGRPSAHRDSPRAGNVSAGGTQPFGSHLTRSGGAPRAMQRSRRLSAMVVFAVAAVLNRSSNHVSTGPKTVRTILPDRSWIVPPRPHQSAQSMNSGALQARRTARAGRITAGLLSKAWMRSKRSRDRRRIRHAVFHASQPVRAAPVSRSGASTMRTPNHSHSCPPTRRLLLVVTSVTS